MKPLLLPFATAIVACSVLAGSPAGAGIPSAANSDVDPCLRVCPGGDMNFHVVVRDVLNNPVAGADVAIDLCSCPGVVLCPAAPSDPYVVSGCLVIVTADAAGVADLPLRAGGTCLGQVNVYASGMLLRTLPAVSSPDQSGDLTVNAVDAGILAAKLGGPYDATGDLNCSLALEAGDPSVQSLHVGHTCGAVVPVRPSSWGTIKTIYR